MADNEAKSGASVRFQQVVKRYGRSPEIIQGISLEIRAGEFVVLVGPSGCGKSTLLRMLAGLEDITSGEIWIGEKKVNDLPPSDRGVAMVFQDYALYPHMTVRENLSFGMKMRRRKDRLSGEEQQRRIQAAAELLGIEELLDRKPAQLSGGQRQRVAIGRALVKEPQVFLFDEPLSNLDAKLRAETRVEIAALHRRLGSTSIYVTHDQVEAMTLADRLVVLKQGVIQQEGRPMEIYRNPSNRFVASFLGNPGMNFLEGRLDSRDGERVFAFRAGATEGVLNLSFLLGTPDVPGAEPGHGSLALGIRPESLRIARRVEEFASPQAPVNAPVNAISELHEQSIAQGLSGQALRVTGQVVAVEIQGYEVQIHAQVGESRWVIRAKSTDLKPGEHCWIELDRSAIYWFDAQGARLRFEAEAPAATEIQPTQEEVHAQGLQRQPAPKGAPGRKREREAEL